MPLAVSKLRPTGAVRGTLFWILQQLARLRWRANWFHWPIDRSLYRWGLSYGLDRTYTR